MVLYRTTGGVEWEQMIRKDQKISLARKNYIVSSSLTTSELKICLYCGEITKLKVCLRDVDLLKISYLTFSAQDNRVIQEYWFL